MSRKLPNPIISLPSYIKVSALESRVGWTLARNNERTNELPSYALFTGSGSLNASNTRLLSLTYKVLTTTQPPYLYNLISIQRPCSTRSSSVVTLARPPSSSSLKITDHSFRYASPCLWNQLPFSLRQPHSGTSSSISYSPIPSPITSSSSDSPLCTSITPSLSPSLPA